MPRIEIESERVERDEQLAESSTEVFDRLDFAARAIALLRPRNTRVAICEGDRAVRVDVGRQWGAPHRARWAVVHVPPDASRRAIARAVLGLYDGNGDVMSTHLPYRSSRAWALDVLMTELR
jgi:hypothetical protein